MNWFTWSFCARGCCFKPFPFMVTIFMDIVYDRQYLARGSEEVKKAFWH